MKIILRNVKPMDHLGAVAREVQTSAIRVGGRETLKQVVLLLPKVEFRNRDGRELSLSIALKEEREAVRIGIDEWFEQHGVDHGEDIGGRAHTYCEGGP